MEEAFFMLTSTPLISIVMPVNNTGKYLRECIETIITQSYMNWELIAVNNGSTDDSLSILREYEKSDSRIRVFHLNEANLLKALRVGYKHTKGNCIHRMDSDDKMPMYKLETMLAALIDYGTGSVITGGTSYFTDDGTVGDGFKRYDNWLCEVARLNSHNSEIYRECVIPSNCWLVYREDFELVGGFNPDIFPEDYDLCFRFYAHKLNIVGLDTILHLWRDRPDRISRNWDCYKDNRFFELKVNYFISVERDYSRPLVIWGAGKNGKDLVKLFQESKNEIYWVCDNERKIGKDIYGIRMQPFKSIATLTKPQIIISVASPKDQIEIENYLKENNKVKGADYWFFS
jgi:glycosyltransferase involved in cell wall biosynthesis